ncbi:hypothetical protein B0H10DRAFT_1711934, partial [Mycena sp. CBHHK59/15]
VKNTSGDKKIMVFKCIREAILPEYYVLEPGTVADRCRVKIDWLQSHYKTQAKKLQQTSRGIGVEAVEEEEGKEYMAFYIPPTGPDCTTVPEAVNIWEQIQGEFEFFPLLHQI